VSLSGSFSNNRLVFCSSTSAAILLLKYYPPLEHWKMLAELPIGHLLLPAEELVKFLSHLAAQTVVITRILCILCMLCDGSL
jgi:hypothetical protein